MSYKLQISGPIPVKNNLPRSTLQRFVVNPTVLIAQWLHTHQPPVEPMRPDSHTSSSKPKDIQTEDQILDQINVVYISDAQSTTSPDIPPGDILLHAGDLTNKGIFEELHKQLSWLNTQPHQHNIVIASNHDSLLDENFINTHPECIAREHLERRSQ